MDNREFYESLPKFSSEVPAGTTRRVHNTRIAASRARAYTVSSMRNAEAMRKSAQHWAVKGREAVAALYMEQARLYEEVGKRYAEVAENAERIARLIEEMGE